MELPQAIILEERKGLTQLCGCSFGRRRLISTTNILSGAVGFRGDVIQLNRNLANNHDAMICERFDLKARTHGR
jgi:hypothetical protein